MWVCVRVNMSLSLDDGTWLHLKAASVLDSVGQNPKVIDDVRWRDVQSAATEKTKTDEAHYNENGADRCCAGDF